MINIAKSTITELQKFISGGHISKGSLIDFVSTNISKYEDQIKAFITLNNPLGAGSSSVTLDLRNSENLKESWSPLLGIPVSVKDVFNTKNIKTTAGSKILEDYIPPFSATVYKRLKNRGALLVGKTNMDEFAHGFTNEYSAFYPTKNPWNLNKVPGGSSGGSAASISAGMAFLSLASENYGSIVQPSSLCGVVGFKPTYGRSSRYGIIAMASSLECPGIIGRCVEDVALGISSILGKDPLDATSIESKKESLHENISRDVSGAKIAIIRPFLELVGAEISGVVENFGKVMESLGVGVDYIDWYDLEIDGKVYDILYRSEVSSNLARYDGMRFGHQPEGVDDLHEYYVKSREKFGVHVKRQIVTSPVSLSENADLYNTALKVRHLNRNFVDGLLEKYSVIITPATVFTDLDIGASADSEWREKNRNLGKINSALMCPSVLFGYPAMSIPAGFSKNNMPIGVHAFSKRMGEQNLIDTGFAFQEKTGLKFLNPFNE